MVEPKRVLARLLGSSRDARYRVIGLAVVSVALLALSTLVLDWFRIVGMMVSATDSVTIDMRHLNVCKAGVCASVAVPAKSNTMYWTVAPFAYWLALAFAALVAFQVGCRVVTGAAPEKVSRAGYLLGTLVFVTGGTAAYIFTPLGGEGVDGILQIQRTWAPLMFLAGALAGMFALYFAIDHGWDSLDTNYPHATARVVGRTSATGPVSPTASTVPLPVASIPAADAFARALPPSTSAASPRAATPTPRASTPLPFAPAFAHDLAFSTRTVELTGGGIDARRDDAKEVLVLWRDVVGVVARRLPAELDPDGATFVDIVSTAGSTLRILPWTRVRATGVPAGAVDDTRARVLVELVVQHCPQTRLDPSTKAFVDGKPAGQLADRAMLAAHDARLA